MREIPGLHRTPLNTLENLRLNHNQNNISVDIISIGISTSLTKFSWKMEGVDSEWSNPSDLQTITYASLPSGKHILKIRMLDSSLSQVIDERLFYINIAPPFWETWWFRSVIIILLVIIILAIFRARINHLNQLHTADKIRSFTNMAHDIRTSLTLINAPIEKLNGEKNLSKEGAYNLSIATEQSKRLTFFTTQLLDFQKADIGKEQLFLSMTDIVILIRQRVFMFKVAAVENQIEVTYSSNIDTYLTAVDELKIEKAIDNLLSNAIKYSLPGGKVEVVLRCEEKEWFLTVRDYGMGISKNAQSKLFKEFYRGDNKINSRIVGSGIGLLLAKNYITMHDGEISVQSEENNGSLFKIIIPYKKVSEHDNVLYRKNIYNEISKLPAHSTDILNESREVDKKMKYLLVVEDNIDLQSFLSRSFKHQYIINSASDGQEAWDMIQKKTPDLIISDVKMPVMNGFELCQLVKSTFETSHIPIILLTSLTEKVHQLEGLRLGADDYITKPFDMNLLDQRIKSLVRNREIVRDRALKLMGRIENGDQPILNNDLNDQFLKKALEVVQKNIDKCEFSKEDFAKEMFVSTSLLYKKLKALTGQSPVLFIRDIRMNHAMELLKTGKYTITEISEACGFSSLAYFGTVFKKYFGKSATDIFNSNE
jgi:signal transduction histidine kinase/DNA-binding response OmpR family regulator